MSEAKWQPGMTLDELERLVIEKALRFYSGNKTQTANALGISLNTLRAKLDSYGGADQAIADQIKQETEARQAGVRGPIPAEPVEPPPHVDPPMKMDPAVVAEKVASTKKPSARKRA